MSELKTRYIVDTYLDYFNSGKHVLAQIYLKSEADKVIAEKDKELRHQKYKRCLAWAAFWEIKSAMLMVVRIGSNAEWYRLKYENRATKWRELAEHFKPEAR